jgi:hypothetical protein
LERPHTLNNISNPVLYVMIQLPINSDLLKPVYELMDGLPPYLKTGNVLMLLVAIAILVLLSLLEPGRKKNRLATSYFGSGREKSKARSLGNRQIRAKQVNNVSLYIGRRHRQSTYPMPNAVRQFVVAQAQAKRFQ